jgi:hypothetical protein
MDFLDFGCFLFLKFWFCCWVWWGGVVVDDDDGEAVLRDEREKLG